MREVGLFLSMKDYNFIISNEAVITLIQLSSGIPTDSGKIITLSSSYGTYF